MVGLASWLLRSSSRRGVRSVIEVDMQIGSLKSERCEAAWIPVRAQTWPAYDASGEFTAQARNASVSCRCGVFSVAEPS